MTEESKRAGEGTKQEPKKRYEAPRVLVREPLEAVATVCSTGTAKADPGMCPEGPISS